MIIKRIILGLIVLGVLVGSLMYGFNANPVSADPSAGPVVGVNGDIEQATVVPQSDLRKLPGSN